MNELYHHGVKGMKWGVRKKQSGLGTFRETRAMLRNTLRTDEKKKIKDAIKNGQSFIYNSQHNILNTSIQEANRFAMDEANRAAINASLQAASLSMSGGMNPFMFGMM